MESLKERRNRIGLTQKELAKICECNHSHISHIESGRADPSFVLFARMIGALDTTAAKLLEMLKMRSATASVTDLQIERRKRR